MDTPTDEVTVTFTRDRVYELLAHLLASADTCAVEPAYYGTFRLLDAASRFSAAVLECGLADEWLSQLHRDIEANKLLLMTDREAYYAFLPEASRRVAERLVSTGYGQMRGTPQ